MIDSHCHLAGEEFELDLDAVVARARATGITRALVILAAQDDAEWTRAQTLPERWPAVRFAAGIHPHQAHLFAADPAAAATAVAARLDQSQHVRAIGEIGLDYHYDFSPKDVQAAVFRAQLALAQARGLPVAIHTREAEADTLRFIAEAQARGPLRGVFHCFTGDVAVAARAAATGFYLSFAGILTFPRAVAVREAVSMVPLERLLLETDAPYLAPVPHRGKRNEPAFVALTAAVVARERGLTLEELVAAVTANFDRLFVADRPQTAFAQALSGDEPR
ncbi:MAG TPA: TatD family hydrolase [Vicinamibacterales bacterium]|nr:TatD family hydrolase [Vicinamibacterales bacterium]